jgi:hypothetical protein
MGELLDEKVVEAALHCTNFAPDGVFEAFQQGAAKMRPRACLFRHFSDLGSRTFSAVLGRALIPS